MSKIIALEGLDGSGKTTALALIKNFFAQYRIPFVISSEMSSNYSVLEGRYKQFRELFMHYDWTKKEELCLISAMRLWHYRTVIEPSLSQNINVVMDRYIDSTWAYQSYDNKLDAEVAIMTDVFWKMPSPTAVLLFYNNKIKSPTDRVEQRVLTVKEYILKKYKERVQTSKEVKFYTYNMTSSQLDVNAKIIKDLHEIMNI